MSPTLALVLQFVGVPALACLLVWLFETGPLSPQERRNRAQRRRDARGGYDGPCRRRGYEPPPQLRHLYKPEQDNQ